MEEKSRGREEEGEEGGGRGRGEKEGEGRESSLELGNGRKHVDELDDATAKEIELPKDLSFAEVKLCQEDE